MSQIVFLVVLATFILFALAIVWRPSTVLAMGICVYPFEQWAQANSSYFGQNSSFLNMGFGVLTLWAIICVISRGQNILKIVPTSFWVWLSLYIFAGISCFWSVDRTGSLFLYQYHFPYVITFVLLLPFVIQTDQDIRYGFVTALLFGTVVMFLLLIMTHTHAWGRTIEVAEGVVDRVGESRTRLGPLAVAEMSGQLMLIALLMNYTGAGRLLQMIRWVVAFMAFALIYRSGSRGQLIAALFALITCLPMSRGITRLTGWIASGVSIALILGFAVLSFTGFNQDADRWSFTTMQSSFSETRIQLSLDLLEFWIESPPYHWLIGLGSSASYDSRIIGQYCHIVIVEMLAELGLIGLLGFLLLIGLVARDAYRLYHLKNTNPVDRGVTVALIAIFFYEMILTFKQGSFLTHTFTFGIGLMISRQLQIATAQQKKTQLREWYRWWHQYQAQTAAIAPNPVAPPIGSSDSMSTSA